MKREDLQNLVDTAKDESVRQMAQAELQKLDLVEKAAEGDDLAKALLALKDVVDTFKKNQPQTSKGSGANVSQQQVEEIVKALMQQSKIRYEDLDPELKAKLSGQVKVQLTLTTPTSLATSSGAISLQQLTRSLFQKLLSDFKARNNVYLYGGAGTGKTYVAEQLADFLGYDYVEINCNQFTSPLDLVGGQTIEGYQKGKLEIAWTNISKNGDEMKGAVLCLDELPKLDPNTAGLLNAALAKIKNVSPTKTPYIYNGKGEKIYLKNLFVIATGNTKLNETSVEYEANFKQDLSLQDRFVGATYEVVADYRSEFEAVMKDFAFIWLYMTKVREYILENRWTGFAFVSIRIMQSMRDTYVVYRDLESQKINPDYAIESPKTLRQSLDSFLNLFKTTQREAIMAATNYDKFVNEIIPEKNNLPISEMNTKKELELVNEIIVANELLQKNKIA